MRHRAAVLFAAGLVIVLPAGVTAQPAPTEAPAALDYAAQALALEDLINANYAYPERLPGGRFALTDALRTEAAAAASTRALLRVAERALLLLADHHAITGSSFADSWAVVPSYADLWIEHDANGYTISAVRNGSPAERAGIRAGDILEAVSGAPTRDAVAAFWADLGADVTAERADFAARVLAAGRRDRMRVLTVRRPGGGAREVTLPTLYSQAAEQPLVSVREEGDAKVITFGNSLGEEATIAAFDAAMAGARSGQPIVLDLTSTAGGGNTTVARAIMGWFTDYPTPYQMHDVPAEERRTAIARRWIELVMPRAGKHHAGPVTVRVGRWTGSMGEGLAIGMAELGACVTGSRMAGLRGAIHDLELGDTGVTVKLPVERLFTVDGTPRENFVPLVDCGLPVRDAPLADDRPE